MGSRLRQPSQPDRRRLTSLHPKMILITYKSDAHPFTSPALLSVVRSCDNPYVSQHAMHVAHARR